MEKELGHHLMSDGRIHIISLSILENGNYVSTSVHIWPDGHSSECKIFHDSSPSVEQDLINLIEEQIADGSYIANLAE